MSFLVPILCLLAITSLLPQGSESTEVTTTNPLRFLLLCSPGSTRRNTCEKCTKVTKDPKTFQMCCENELGVLTWCEKFLNPSTFINPDVS